MEDRASVLFSNFVLLLDILSIRIYATIGYLIIYILPVMVFLLIP